jgi:hypothetical protein
MRFLLRKLPKETSAELEAFKAETAEPYRPLPAPVYILLPRNSKLVSVKGPFDFFTTRDIEKMKAGGQYFYGPILGRVEPFIQAARDVGTMLGWSSPTATSVLEPAPYEISDAVLRKLGTLWAPVHSAEGSEAETSIGIESYFAVAFANELCEPIPAERIELARERDPDLYEIALLRSGVFVFLALHLGYLDLKMLSALRLRFFNELINITGIESFIPLSMELAELKRWTENLIHSPDVHLISSDQFAYSISRVTQKLRSRLTRVRKELCDPSAELAHTYDQGGLGTFREDEDEEGGEDG